MTWNELVYGLGDLLEATFKILPPLGNIPNIIFIAILLVAFVYWLGQLRKYHKEAVESGNPE